MASTPQYGGDGTVPDLNIGQPGSGLYPASAHFRVQVLAGREEPKSVLNPVPQQAAVFEDISGPRGRFFRWTGSLVVKEIADLYGIENLCNQLWDGHSRTLGVDGAFDVGAFNADNVQPTRLTDIWGTVLSTKARIVDFSRDAPIRKLYGNPTYTYITALTVVFRTMP